MARANWCTSSTRRAAATGHDGYFRGSGRAYSGRADQGASGRGCARVRGDPTNRLSTARITIGRGNARGRVRLVLGTDQKPAAWPDSSGNGHVPRPGRKARTKSALGEAVATGQVSSRAPVASASVRLGIRLRVRTRIGGSAACQRSWRMVHVGCRREPVDAPRSGCLLATDQLSVDDRHCRPVPPRRCGNCAGRTASRRPAAEDVNEAPPAARPAGRRRAAGHPRRRTAHAGEPAAASQRRPSARPDGYELTAASERPCVAHAAGCHWNCSA